MFVAHFYVNNAKTGKLNLEKVIVYVGFKVLTPVVMKNSVFCVIKPCSHLEINRCFVVKFSSPLTSVFFLL
jgi:hypothetical protein